MISGGKSTGAATLVLERTETIDLPPRILELRKKIQSPEYLDNAIQRIAQVISNHLIEDPDKLKFRDKIKIDVEIKNIRVTGIIRKEMISHVSVKINRNHFSLIRLYMKIMMLNVRELQQFRM